MGRIEVASVTTAAEGYSGLVIFFLFSAPGFGFRVNLAYFSLACHLLSSPLLLLGLAIVSD
jgi:hypothetical protein